jgi:PAS domain S-box-containing protein
VSDEAHRMIKQEIVSHRGGMRFAQLERALRANEDRWGAVLANPFMGITVLDKDQYFIMANSAFQTMVGYTEDELKKITPLDITPASERETNQALFSELQQGKRQHFELVKRLRRKDGQLIWIQLYVFRIADRAETGQHTFGMVFDITEKMQAQDALQAAHAELGRSAHVSRMGAMTASIAHEMNQPLAAVVGFGSAGLRWLEQTPAAIDKARECLGNIVRAGQSAADVLESVRAMFKSKKLANVPIDLNQLIEEVLTLVQGAVKKHDIAVHIELDRAIMPVVGNRIQLQQVLFNLVVNAIEAMESVADRTLLIKSEREDSGEVRITVEDSGTGIEPQHVDKIFGSFFTTKVEGMGMGLSICRSIVESNGGRLWASPGRSRGAVFQFTRNKAYIGDFLRMSVSDPGRTRASQSNLDQLCVRIKGE